MDTPHVKAGSQTFTSSGSWQAPAGISSVQAEVWGGGGGGGGQDASSDGGGGGGGGAYSLKANISVTPLSYYTVTVGTGGTGGTACGGGGTGGDSWFVDTGTVLAKGGSGGTCSTGTPPPGGAGGDASSGIGDTKYSGGYGEEGRDNPNGLGGYGGSSAGTAANGIDASSQSWSTNTYPTGSTPTGAGHGGDGGDKNANGSAPVSGYGGGGGGSGEGSSMSGGNGYGGKVTITWTPTLSVTVSDGIVTYGLLDTSATKDTTSGDLNDTQQADNGSAVAVNFNIMGQDSANWTLAGSPGSEQYAHSFCTSGAGAPDPCDTTPSWTALTTGYQTLATNVAADTGYQRFDLRLEMPTSTSNYGQQSVTVTVQVVEYVP